MSATLEHRDALARLVHSAGANTLAMLVVVLPSAALLAHASASSMWFVPKVAGTYLLATIALARFLPDHLPHRVLGPANQVTLLRLGLTALLAGFLGEGRDGAWLAVGVASLALVLDAVDGALARRKGWASAFGARFDMETDALLIMLMAALVFAQDKAGAWILIAGSLRYLFVAAALFWPWLGRPLPASRRRQAVCVAQVLTLLLALAPGVQRPWSDGIAALGLLLLMYSFTCDIAWARRRARQRRQGDSA